MAAVASIGPLDYLINNAGVLSVGHLSRMSDTDLERMTATNLVAPMALTRDLLPALRSAKGRIVNIGSVFGDIATHFLQAIPQPNLACAGFPTP